MSDPSRPGQDGDAGTRIRDGAGRRGIGANDETAGRSRVHPRDAGRVDPALEYVTFGYSVHHLLKVVLIQFFLLFLDVKLIGYARYLDAGTNRGLVVTGTWLAASIVFLAVLVALVRQIGRRTLTPRFHDPVHIGISIASYLITSGLSFAFGYVTFLLPGRRLPPMTPGVVLPGWLFTVMFATFIAIGYHAQVAVTDAPSVQTITDVIGDWLDSLAWVHEPPDSLARERAYDRFVERSDDLEELLTNARTLGGRRLEVEFVEWRERFENRSMLSREQIIEGRSVEDGLESARLATEHAAFEDLRTRLESLVETDQ